MAGKSLYLIDGSSYLFRAYHALPSLANSEGVPTGAVYGFTNMILKIIRDEHPEAIVVVFDSAGPTERHRQYTDYKANRGQMPDDLSRQLPYVYRALAARGEARRQTGEHRGRRRDRWIVRIRRAPVRGTGCDGRNIARRIPDLQFP